MLEEYVSALKKTFRRWRDVRAGLLAGGLAYFAIFSATPLLVVLIAILGRLIAQARMMAQLDRVLSPRMGGLIREWLVPVNSSALPTLTFFSVIMLLYGASQVFIQLRESLDVIWGVPVRTKAGWRGIFNSIVAPLLMIVSAGLFILTFVLFEAGIGIASRIFGTILPILGNAALWKAASFAASLALFTLLFAAIFKWASSLELPWHDVWPGAALTSVLFALGKIALALYFSWRSFDSLYGAAGSLIVIMVWVYISAQIFFFGAVFTQVRASLKQRREKTAESLS